MPLFHFHLVLDGEREHLGSMDLSRRGDAIPAGLKLTTQIVAAVVGRTVDAGGLQVQAVDEAGTVVYTFDVVCRPRDPDRLDCYLH